MRELMNLTGKQYGKLTVLGIHHRANYQTYWNCACSCGNQVVVRGAALTSGKTKSCGCARKTASKFRFIDLTGKTFNGIQILEFSHKDKSYKSYWKCRCHCGKEFIGQGYEIERGHTKSCGCTKYQALLESNITHGKSNTRLYRIWAGMIGRCYEPHSSAFARYGGRGITVCNEWRNDFQAFHDWAYANGYDENAEKGQCTIDRIDNNKGYSPDNCRWVNMRKQCNNTNRNRFVEYNGENLTIAELSRKYKMPYKLVYKRIHNFGWSAADAIEKPKETQSKRSE